MIAVTWDEQANGSRRVALGRGTPDDSGAIRFTRQAISAEGPASYPVVVSADEGLVVAWTSGSAGSRMIRFERFN